MMEGTLRKLEIQYEAKLPNMFSPLNRLVVLFNPDTIQYKHAPRWKATEISSQVANDVRSVFEFQSLTPTTLTFDLFFDLSLEEEALSLGEALATKYMPEVSVLRGRSQAREKSLVERMESFKRLAEVDQELHRPPRCKLMWGARFLLEGVLTSLDRKFTAFLPDGTPSRATFSCAFTSVESEARRRLLELHSADVAKRRVVRQGDTLQGIAHEEYGDATLWRPIARENRLLDPRRLVPGLRLIIPPLT